MAASHYFELVSFTCMLPIPKERRNQARSYKVNFQHKITLQIGQIKTSQTRGQPYSGTSPIVDNASLQRVKFIQ